MLPTPLTSSAAERRSVRPSPSTLVIFGASGDLSRRKLLPGLYNLAVDDVLPERFAIVGLGRTAMTDDEFRSLARRGIEEFSRRTLDEAVWKGFSSRLFFQRGSADEPSSVADLRVRLEEIERSLEMPSNRIYYLAVPPSLVIPSVAGLKEAGLVAAPSGPVYSRVIVEKPIGHDLASAQQINEAVCRVFDESQVFRIDHYLGKETVQNILVFRFANSLFEPLFNQKYIDHVQITVAESGGVGTRAGYYEEAGALRDMVQNHLLQLLALVAMEPPWSLDADVVRDMRRGVLRSLRPVEGDAVDANVIRAQYGSGAVGGKPVPGYRRESGVAPDSTRETYVALCAHVDNWRWAGVPFFLRTGKRLARHTTEIVFQLKDVPPILFNANPGARLPANTITLRIQPDEGFSIGICSKTPGPRVAVRPVSMDYEYGPSFEKVTPEAYERLLLDVMVGDATLFMRRDTVEASWAWVTPILERWAQREERWLPEYSAGTWGPVEADRLIESNGRHWTV
jgi:glucose-6-phosphate 1-dehydrogenase